MKIEVNKISNVELLRKCASFTSGKNSKMSLLTAYRNKHSIIRSQLFVIEMTDIPLFCASQFVRSTQGVNWYQRTKRTDRGGEDFCKVCNSLADDLTTAWNNEDMDAHGDATCEVRTLSDRFDRYTPTSLCAIMNAEAIINMSEKRLCSMASRDTREIWGQVIREVAELDPDLAKFCVRPCVSHGGICRESKCCGYNKTTIGMREINNYKKIFEI